MTFDRRRKRKREGVQLGALPCGGVRWRGRRGWWQEPRCGGTGIGGVGAGDGVEGSGVGEEGGLGRWAVVG
jgi:hypothetical protein